MTDCLGQIVRKQPCALFCQVWGGWIDRYLSTFRGAAPHLSDYGQDPSVLPGQITITVQGVWVLMASPSTGHLNWATLNLLAWAGSK